MTDEIMNLRTILEKSSNADVLREMIGSTAQSLLELEVKARHIVRPQSVRGTERPRHPA